MTFSSADLIEALRRRRRPPGRPEPPPGEFPPEWKTWFAAMQERIGAITGATADAIVAIFFAREPVAAPRAAIALNRWGAFTTLWRQQWHPASEDERGTRIVAIVVTVLVHIFFAAFLLYLAYVRFIAVPPEAKAGEEDVIQVEYIGDGTPKDPGGGAAQGESKPDTAAAPSKTSPAAASQPPRPTAAQRAPSEPADATPQAPVPTPPVDQPLQVTETPAPDQTFVLPPPRPMDIPPTTAPTPDVQTPAPTVRIVEIPVPFQAPAPRDTPSAAIKAPDIAQRPAEVTIRDVPSPLPPVQVKEIAPRPLAAPELRTEAPTIAERTIPTPPGPTTPPAPAPSAQPATTPSAAANANPPSNAAPAGAKVATTTGTRPDVPGAGRGAAPSPKPGAMPSPKPGDDWGVSDRNRPGGEAGKSGGLFNADGSPKLVGGVKVGGGLPPGTVTEDFAKIDRNGTWLKRPSADYSPTSFDKFWVPNETLLQEWVRKSIKEVLIPIPGTSKTIKCSIVVLALGGGCDISDPNMQDVEANARKPPDVPFKRELQEDQKSLGPPVDGAQKP